MSLQSLVTRDFETRMQQVSTDAESAKQVKVQLEAERASLQNKCDKLQGELIDYQARCS